MVITKTDYGDIIFGRVKETQKGYRSNSEKQTIVTIQCTQTGKEVKMHCWNNEHSTLSDRARKLHEGDIISARVQFDIGDETKCTCYEMKKAGLYKTSRKGFEQYVLVGKVAKATKGKTVTCFMIPSYNYVDNKKVTYWYQVCFWNSEAEKAAREIKKDDVICVRASKLKENTYNGFSYKELNATEYVVVRK